MPKKADNGYHLEASGLALDNARRHENDAPLSLFGSCFCPFVQRAWVALDHSQLDYKYIEVDPYQKPKELLEVSPRGLVPGLKLNDTNPPRAVAESSIVMEYVDELARSQGKPALLPEDLYARSLVRFQADHINRHIIPAFYRYLQAQETEKQMEGLKEFAEAIEQLFKMFDNAAKNTPEAVGLFKEGGKLGWSDVMAVPWLFRTTNVLKHYRAFDVNAVDRLDGYLKRLLENEHVKHTCSGEELYLDSYARYAENRPHTSQVANATNSGRGLP